MEQATTMILKNSVLPVNIGNRKYPTVQHYVLSSLLKDQVHQDILLSYPTDKIQLIFNSFDQEQYMSVVYHACNKFNEKKCRSVQRKDNKTIGFLTRKLIKDHSDFLYKAKNPSNSVIGLQEVENILYGYNLIGHSLLRIKYLLEKVPEFSDDLTEYIFWKTHPEHQDIIKSKGKTYKTIITTSSKKKKEKNITREDEPLGYFYEGEYNDEEEGEEEGYYPEEVIPIYRDDRVHWIASNANAHLDDTRGIGADVEMLYATETAPTDPFHLSSEVDLYSRTDPLYIFKIYKATEYMVEMIKNGHDIKMFLYKPIDAILWEGKVSPEFFAGSSLTTKQRHLIYVEYWNKFMSKTIPFYSLIEKEILYPQNLAGFIRKEYALELNKNIGHKIKEVLFSSFLYQVIERSYPHVAPELKIIVMNRERQNFSLEEYEAMTNKLYHLFFEKKFLVDEEGVRRIMLLESYRLTQQEIDEALHFLPRKFIANNSLSINDTILDPMSEVEVLIDGKLFHDLFQYLYYQLFIFYGNLSSTDAYQLLFHNGEMLSGNSPRLPKTLSNLVQSKRMEYLQQGVLAKYNQYPQVQEILLYSKATNQPIQSTTEEENMNVWNNIKTDPTDLQLMKWVVSIIPENNLHFEKSIYLYFFIHDLMRSMGLMKSILGKRIQEKSLNTFLQCFYPKLEIITKKVKTTQPIPKEFVSYIHKKNVITETTTNLLWKKLYPFVYLFQQEKFIPSKLFQEAKEQYSSITRDDLIHALANVVKCLYKDQNVPNDHFYILTQIISGKDDIVMWSDPSFEMIHEVEEGEDHPLLKEINKKLARKKKTTKAKMELVQYNIIHPFYEIKYNLLQEAFGRPSSNDPVVSRASYALAALEKETIHPRRIVFYL